ncbi:hypothetical protein Tco_1205911 [Tanacetum coccineum]
MAKKTKETQAGGSRPRHLWNQGEELLLVECFIQISDDPKVVLETSVMGRENDEDWMTRVEILYKTHMGSDFKHKSAWLFLEYMHKWKNPESTLARQNRLQVTDVEPEHFEEDVLSRPPWAQRIAKSQRSSNSTASSGLNPAMFQNDATTIRVRPQGKDEGYRARDKREI